MSVLENIRAKIVDTVDFDYENVVFTNGCFDILHEGHVTYLAKAAELGDHLVVGVNSDDSVRRLKGEGRPYHGEDSRALVLASLAFVDNVVIFDEDTPIKVIEALRPKIIAKGGDYVAEEVVGYGIAEEVVIIDLVDGHSTTGTLDKMR